MGDWQTGDTSLLWHPNRTRPRENQQWRGLRTTVLIFSGPVEAQTWLPVFIFRMALRNRCSPSKMTELQQSRKKKESPKIQMCKTNTDVFEMTWRTQSLKSSDWMWLKWHISDYLTHFYRYTIWKKKRKIEHHGCLISTTQVCCVSVQLYTNFRWCCWP